MSWVPSPTTARHLFYGILIGFSLSFASTSVISAYRKRRGYSATVSTDVRPIELRSDEVLDGVTGLIGTWSRSRPVMFGSQGGLGNKETLRWSGSIRSAMRWVLRFLARQRCASNAKVWSCGDSIVSENQPLYIVPQPRGQRKGPCRTQKYVQFDVRKGPAPVNHSLAK